MRSANEAALIPYLTVGYPSLDATRWLVPLLAREGADLIELGVPFSDPLADGATVQRASHAALEQGVRALAADYVEVADAVRAADDRRELIFTTVLAGVYDLKGAEAHQFGRLFHALHLAALTRAPGEAAAFSDGPGRALIAMLGSNFPVD